MTFDSFEYALLLALVVPLFIVLPGRMRAGLLLLASFGFYAVWSIEMTALIVVSALVDFTIGLLLAKTDDKLRRKLLLIISITVNLGILGYFKYKGFFLENLHALGLVEPGSWVEVLLPPGISFYTFQTMSYSIDVYRRELEPTRKLGHFMLFVCFYPQLIAGPIERAASLLPQLGSLGERRITGSDIDAGLRLIILGLFKKVVVADYAGTLADRAFADPGAVGGWTLLCACYLFTLQIYFDFSAYSEIAKGSARLVGVELVWNFDQPYLSRNVAEFWRRWHISLSTWFRDYVYKPLGGSRVGKARVLFNLTATMFLSGLWHGAAWNFVLWGLFHGLLLLLHHQLADRRPFVVLRERWPIATSAVAWFSTLHLVIFGWLLFRVDALADVGTALTSMGRIFIGRADAIRPVELGVILGFFAIVGVQYVVRRTRLFERLPASATLSLVVYATMAVLAILLARDQAPQFIYFQF
jgi:alginate O-acetyltransferase complex protein AlgI